MGVYTYTANFYLIKESVKYEIKVKKLNIKTENTQIFDFIATENEISAEF